MPNVAIDSLAERPPLTPFTNRFGEHLLYEVNREAFSQISAHDRLQTHLGKALSAKDSLHIILGSDSGLLIPLLRGMERPPSSRYLIIEIPTVIQWLERQGLLDDLPVDMRCVTLDDWASVAHELKIVDYGYINGIRLHHSFAVMDAFLPEYADLRWRMTEDLNQLHWDIQAQLGNESFTYCQLRNLGDFQQPAALLKGLYKGRTAILLAGGPSLDETLPWVQVHRDKLLVLSVSRISRRLLQVGIEPDFVFSIDPTDMSFDISREMLGFSPATSLVHAFHITPLLLGAWRHRAFYMGPMLPWNSPLNRKDNASGPGPTVTNTALWCAGEMGCSTIILAGVDLCFSASGHTHAQGSNETQAGPRLEPAAIQIETQVGDTANTTPDFASAIKILGLQAATLGKKGIKLVNPSPHAAKIEGIEFIECDSIPLDDGLFEPARGLAEHVPPLDSPQRLKQRQKLQQELRHALFACGKIQAMAKDAIDLNSLFYRSKDRGEALRHKAGMDRIEMSFKRELRAMASLTKALGIRDFLRITRPHESIIEAEFSVTEELTRMYYESYRDGTQRLKALIEECAERLDSRMAEESSCPDLSALTAQWLQDRQPGRARVWMSRHPEAVARPTPDDLERLEVCLREFDTQMGETDTAHARRARGHARLSASIDRARLLFSHRDQDGLERLIHTLEHHPEQEDAMLYQAFARGLLAELAGDVEAAMEHYLPIFEAQFEPLLENALIRVASCYLAMEHPEGAFMTLETLSGLSPIYRPHLVELLYTMDRLNEAADLCHAHLRIFPEDTSTQLKLARIYAESGARESARMMLNYILDKNPDNTTARHMLEAIDHKGA